LTELTWRIAFAATIPAAPLAIFQRIDQPAVAIRRQCLQDLKKSCFFDCIQIGDSLKYMEYTKPTWVDRHLRLLQ
jgi:hypothetical protein